MLIPYPIDLFIVIEASLPVACSAEDKGITHRRKANGGIGDVLTPTYYYQNAVERRCGVGLSFLSTRGSVKRCSWIFTQNAVGFSFGCAGGNQHSARALPSLGA